MPIPKLSSTELEGIGWHVSTYSEGGGGSCVEAGPISGRSYVAVRDTKDRERGYFVVSRSAWKAFVGGVVRE